MIDAFSIEHGMEQTSMTNAIKKRLDRKGFTLAEVLVTVAIILILAGVTFVSVAQYQKNLRLMEMDGTAKEIFIAAQNHLSVAKASGDLDRLAEDAKQPESTTASTIGTKLDWTAVSAYAGNADGEYYYVIHNANSGSESCTPSGSDTILGMMLPFGALDETVATGGNYAIVYELKSASVVAVLYSGAGNASFGNAAVIHFGADDVSKINEIYKDKSARKSYQKDGVTAIVGCYTGTAVSAAIPTETLEAPKLEVKNENKLHVLVSGNYSTKDVITLTIHGVQSDTTAIMQLNCKDRGGNTFDVTLDDITSDNTRFTKILNSGRFTRSDETSGDAFIPGENIEISATARATDALATPKTSSVYTTSSLFADANDGRTVYIKNLRHLENLSEDISGFTGKLKVKSEATNGGITAIQKNDITMFSWEGLSSQHYLYCAGTMSDTYIAVNVTYPLSYDGGSHEIYDLSIAPYSGGSVTELNSGIFGNVTDKLSVKNLILRNNKNSKNNSTTNAGMLLGKTSADLTVDGVLAYYHEENYDADNDSKVEVVATADNGIAGGLIGLVSGGTLNVKNSAAAVYVKGVKAAGGLIGSVSGAEEGSTIVQSYAGGHTRDGAYDTEMKVSVPKNQGAGRYNVQASGNAGGFIGVTTDHVTMNAVYSTASAYASSGDVNSNAFAGRGTPKIQTTADGKKNYYAIGTHNGKDADGEDIEKAQLSAGENRRQATAYDRTLMGATETTAHPAMDKTSYPLNTVRHLCAASVDDKDLPWFIKEHVGDWVVSKKTEESNFEVENGNRLTVRINTGKQSISDDLYYVVKVHGMTSNMEAYFLIHADKNGQCIVKRSNDIKNFNNQQDQQLLNQPSICSIKSVAGAKSIEFYLDDITNSNGNFNALCPDLYAGEDIEVNVVPIAKITDVNTTSFDITKSIKTNSLFGYLDKKDSQKKDEHNEQKIDAVQQYNTNAGNEGMGVVPDGNGYYYVQIDNSRHLENLAAGISNYPGSGTVGERIIGAIQTDDIYWSGNSTAYTISFTEELGRNLSVYSNNTIKSRDGHFSPIDNCANVVTYDGCNHKIDGFSVEENGLAGLFSQPQSEITIKNLKVNKSSFVSSSKGAGGLIGENNKHTTIKNVDITDTIVKGSGTSGGFVGFAGNGITIAESGFSNMNVTSTTDAAGGLVGYTGGAETNIENVSCDGERTFVKGKNASGGIIGQTNQFKVTVDGTKFLSKVEVTSENTHAGGVIGDAGAETKIKNTIFSSKLTVSGANSSGGIIGNTYVKATIDGANFQSDVTVTSTNDHAAGVLGITNKEADIENVTFVNKLIVYGYKSSGGILGNTGNKLKLWNISIGGPSTIASDAWDAGGIVGYAESYDTDIQNVKFIGKDTEVIAKQNAGGLCGTLTKNTSKLKISNVAVSAFIQAEQNAGGLIGRLQTSASEGKIEKSYYGGRTKYGQYASITINDHEYASNIHGNQKAGGLIGYIDNTNGLTIDQCFSTGSVENSANNQFAGGFIGAAEQAGVKIKNCYSIGKVGSQNNGGFIGYRYDSSNLTYENAYYLNTFNDLSVKAIGNGSDEENNNLTTKYADNVLGKNKTVDRTVQTNYYDDGLKGEIYPYKNWTTDWESKESSKPIAYYGDWPLPSKLTGELIYFYAKDSANYEKGGLFKVTGQNTNVECYMTPIANLNLKKYGFGIISEYPITDKTSYDNINDRYTWSTSLNGEYKKCKTEGSLDSPKYSIFTYFGKTYYYYRCTTNDGLNIDSGLIYVKEKKNNQEITYQVSVSDGEARFKVDQVKDV